MAREALVSIEDMAAAAYRAYAKAMCGTGFDPCPPDDIDQVPEDFRRKWRSLTEVVVANLSAYENWPWPRIVGAVLTQQRAVFGDKLVEAIGVPNMIAMEAFCRMLAVFMASDNSSEDIRAAIESSYDWTDWAKRKLERLGGAA